MRAQLSVDEQKEASRAAAARILALAQYKSAKTVMAYIAARGELDLTPVIGDILSSGRRLALPLCESPGVMSARLVDGLDQLEPGAYGLMEPSRACRIAAPEEIDMILVPGTAFGRDMSRLGQGGGYYDRYLPKTRAYLAGVCHDAALHDSLPVQAHDVKMDAVIIPGGLILPRNTTRNADV